MVNEIPFEESSGDVFGDLGFGAPEAEWLTAKCALILATKRATADRALTQTETARICGTDQPTLSKVLHGRMECVTIDRLISWLTAMGQDVDIKVQAAPKNRRARLHVRDAA